MSGVAAILVLLTNTDVLIAANAGAASEALIAADAALERTIGELRDSADLSAPLSGVQASSFVDGAAGGRRTLVDGRTIDLDHIVWLAHCQKRTRCSDADMNALRRDRPWGSRNPRWRLFSHGPFDPAPGGPRSGLPLYVLSMIADDQSETDGDPWRDGRQTGPAANPGAGIVLVRAEAFGRRGAHRAVEALVVRQDLADLARWEAADPATRGSRPPPFPFLQVRAWRDVR
jgi:hypothetical protein